MIFNVLLRAQALRCLDDPNDILEGSSQRVKNIVLKPKNTKGSDISQAKG